jgi:hypothetical protein
MAAYSFVEGESSFLATLIMYLASKILRISLEPKNIKFLRAIVP